MMRNGFSGHPLTVQTDLDVNKQAVLNLVLEPSQVGCCFVVLIPRQFRAMGDMESI